MLHVVRIDLAAVLPSGQESQDCFDCTINKLGSRACIFRMVELRKKLFKIPTVYLLYNSMCSKETMVNFEIVFLFQLEGQKG